MVKNCLSCSCTNPLGTPPPSPPRAQHPSKGKFINAVSNMLSILWMVILGDHRIKKKLSKNLILSASPIDQLDEHVVYQYLGSPPPPPPGG